MILLTNAAGKTGRSVVKALTARVVGTGDYVRDKP
jgi:uncharacterized protein YbjT (DUF2867 family)